VSCICFAGLFYIPAVQRLSLSARTGSTNKVNVHAVVEEHLNISSVLKHYRHFHWLYFIQTVNSKCQIICGCFIKGTQPNTTTQQTVGLSIVQDNNKGRVSTIHVRNVTVTEQILIQILLPPVTG